MYFTRHCASTESRILLIVEWWAKRLVRLQFNLFFLILISLWNELIEIFMIKLLGCYCGGFNGIDKDFGTYFLHVMKEIDFLNPITIYKYYILFLG